MKRTFAYLAVAAILLSSCSKTPTTGLNDAAKRYFDAWMSMNHPDLKPTPLGAYVLDEKEGSGKIVGDSKESPYLLVNYVARYLNGTISDYTTEQTAKQLGKYVFGNYYGPKIWRRSNDNLNVGLDEMVTSMRVGGEKTSIIPGWLFTFDRYDNVQGYLDNVSGTNMIYSVEVLESISDIRKWEIDSIGRYLANNFPDVKPTDSLKLGFYYKSLRAPVDTTSYPNDTTVYINYTGRLLNGQVFDTNIADTAKFYGIYKAGGSYKPSSVTWNKDNYTEITLGSSTVIDGFSYGLHHMRRKEKAIFVFMSALGYSSTGSGSNIPGYSPLRFDIEIVDKE